MSSSPSSHSSDHNPPSHRDQEDIIMSDKNIDSPSPKSSSTVSVKKTESSSKVETPKTATSTTSSSVQSTFSSISNSGGTSYKSNRPFDGKPIKREKEASLSSSSSSPPPDSKIAVTSSSSLLPSSSSSKATKVKTGKHSSKKSEGSSKKGDSSAKFDRHSDQVSNRSGKTSKMDVDGEMHDSNSTPMRDHHRNEASSEAKDARHTDRHDDDEDDDDHRHHDRHHHHSEDGRGADMKATSDPAYSTRGRSTTETSSSNNNNNASAGSSGSGIGGGAATGGAGSGDALDRKNRENLEDLGRPTKELAPTNAGTSFLPDTLTEEERRTRTRYLPNVEGMHTLRKNEVKGDLALARILASGSSINNASSHGPKKQKNKRGRNDEDTMDVDEEEGTEPSEDDRLLDASKPGSTTLRFGTKELVLPSTAFLAPKESQLGPHGSIKPADSPDGNNGKQPPGSSPQIISPSLIDSVTAFNPPRPPESVGAKKKHRMLRWERRPEDVEVDLSNYRKTVQQTRQELHNAEAEQERLETIGAHLRRHFLSHLNCLNDEYVRLNEELGLAQQECVKAADLLTSRTRSRGTGKGSYVMRDVFAVLKTRGGDPGEDKADATEQSDLIDASQTFSSGFGGVGGQSFTDWDVRPNLTGSPLADAWVVVGDKVSTPYGQGTVIRVHQSSTLADTEMFPDSGGKSVTNSTSLLSSSLPGFSGRKGTSGKKKSKQDQAVGDVILPPRIYVRLSYGVGIFAPKSVVSIENPSAYTDSELASRWKKLLETAISIGPVLDVEGMGSFVESSLDPVEKPDSAGSMEISGNSKMEMEETEADKNIDGDDNKDNIINKIDNNIEGEKNNNGDSGGDDDDDVVDDDEDKNNNNKDEDPHKESVESEWGEKSGSTKRRYLPFGSGLLPTSIGRGGLLSELSINQIEKSVHDALFNGDGILGYDKNVGVPNDVMEFEKQQEEFFTLQASVLQTRNELYRQRRIRLLNERTYHATSDRSNRVEGLVSEMRSDLKSLKHRLEEELDELGIDEKMAESILGAYYTEQDVRGGIVESPPPPKRARQSSEPESELDDEEADNSHHDDDTSGSRPMNDSGNDDLSGDDLGAHRSAKKPRQHVQ